MIESNIRDLIKERLTSYFPNYEVSDFPINPSDYMPTHPNGELLIKSLGFKVNYLLQNRTANTTDWGNFAIYEYSFRVDLILRDIRTQDEIFKLTNSIINALIEIYYEDYNGRLYLSDCSEAEYDEEKMFQFRTLTFTLPYVGVA